MSNTLPHETVAYKYGLHPPLDWHDRAFDQLRKQTQLWNNLVAIEREHRGRVRDVASADATVTALDAKRTPLVDLLERCKTERAERRRAARKKVPTPELDATIKDVIAQLREMAPTIKEARKTAYRASKDTLRVIENERMAKVKLARQTASAEGLWWGHYNAVLESYEVARSRAAKEGVELKFRHFDGAGRLTNQIINGMSVEDFMQGRKAQARIEPCPDGYRIERPRGCVTRALTVAIYSIDHKPQTITWPIVLHRPLPENGRVQMVTVHRRKRADRWRWHAVVTIRKPVDERIPANTRLAINLGWRQTPQGLRVATLLRDGDSEPQHIYVPKPLLIGHAAGERNRGAQDNDLNDMIGWLRQLPLQDAPEALIEVATEIKSKPKPRPRHFEWLRHTWEAGAGHWCPDDLDKLRAFGYRWRRYWRDDTAGRFWLGNARLDHYRVQVKKLVGDAGTVLINQHDMSQTARSEDTELPQGARHHRVLAAPSELRLVLDNWVRKTGGRVVVRKGPHDVCGHCSGPLGKQNGIALVWQCVSCGRTVDQDENYCRMMLQEAAQEEELVQENKVVRFRSNRRRGQLRDDGEDNV